MQVRDLIAELSLYDPKDRVCVQVTANNCRKVADSEDLATNFTIERVEVENDERHACKIILQ